MRAIVIAELSRAHRCAGVTALSSQPVRKHVGARGDNLRLFLQLSVMIASRQNAWERLQADWGSTGRRFKSCQPDSQPDSSSDVVFPASDRRFGGVRPTRLTQTSLGALPKSVCWRQIFLPTTTKLCQTPVLECLGSHI